VENGYIKILEKGRMPPRVAHDKKKQHSKMPPRVAHDKKKQHSPQTSSNVVVQCTPESIRGQAGIGSTLSLDAIGKQDTYLLGDFSFLKYDLRRHTNFQQYQTVTYVPPVPGIANWPFNGATVIVTLYPKQMGDLLTGMYLQCTMPHLPDVGYPPLDPGQFPDSQYCSNLGRAIVKSIKFRVDQYEIETLYDDWMIMHDELYLTQEQRVANSYLVNGVGNPTVGPLDLYIPLPFFFNSRMTSYFPLCAINNQKITLEILFNPVEFFSNTRVDVAPYTLSLPSFNIVCEQIVLTQEERLAIQKTPSILVAVSRKQPEIQTNIGDLYAKTNLVMNVPVECIHWAFRNTLYEQIDSPGVTSYFLNRFNYSATDSTSIDEQSKYPILSDVTLYINNQTELGFFSDTGNQFTDRANYYKFAEPLKTSLSSPQRNIYTYAFSLAAGKNALSGAIDFNLVPPQTTFLYNQLIAPTTTSNAYTVMVYYSALLQLNFSNGFLSF
jgi:hypothetical protein